MSTPNNLYTRSRITFAIIALIFIASAPGQNASQAPPRTPERDGPAATKTPRGSISGRVLAADTGRPLRRARIFVAGASVGQPRTVATDNDGRYFVPDLPQGVYRLSASRSGYLLIQYGQRRVLEQGKPIELSDGQSIEKVDFVLPRMSTISGRIIDELGDPVEGVTVLAKRWRYRDGERQLVPSGGGLVRSDDTGQYRILGLAPGTYYVMAMTRETWTVSEKTGSRMMGYAPTYFPGTTAASESGQINVNVGQEVTNVDVPLIPGRAINISGTARDSHGTPFRSVVLRQEVRGDGFSSVGSMANGPVASDGTFTIRNIPPGDYRLSASTGPDADRPEVATQTIAAGETDITGVTLVGSEGGTVSGRVVTESRETPVLSRFRVNVDSGASQADQTVTSAFRDAGAASVASDGTFSVKGVFGRSRIRMVLPESWTVKAINHEGRDLIDAVVELGSGEALSNLEIVVTDRVTSLVGQVVDDRGSPLSDGTVVLFSTDRSRQYPSSRYSRVIRPDVRGRVQAKGLPPGEYYGVALDYVEDGVWNDPAFLESITQYAQRLTLAEGETRTVTFRTVSR